MNFCLVPAENECVPPCTELIAHGSHTREVKSLVSSGRASEVPAASWAARGDVWSGGELHPAPRRPYDRSSFLENDTDLAQSKTTKRSMRTEGVGKVMRMRRVGHMTFVA